jgi:hypothetical protein
MIALRVLGKMIMFVIAGAVVLAPEVIINLLLFHVI